MIACLGYTYSVLRGQINSHGMFDFKAGVLTFICRYAPPDLWPQAESPQFSRCEEPTEATDTSAQHHTEGERVYHTYKATGACISPLPSCEPQWFAAKWQDRVHPYMCLSFKHLSSRFSFPAPNHTSSLPTMRLSLCSYPQVVAVTPTTAVLLVGHHRYLGIEWRESPCCYGNWVPQAVPVHDPS